MADEAAKLMADKVYEDEIKKLHDVIREAYEHAIKAHVPAEVIDVVNKYPVLLTGINHVNYHWERCIYSENIRFYAPCSLRYLDDVLDDEERRSIRAILIRLRNVRNKRDVFKDKCLYNLLSLKTRKRIEEVLPEAMEYIQWPSEPIKTLPAVQLEELRFVLQKCKKG